MTHQPLLPGLGPVCPTPGTDPATPPATLWAYPDCAALTLQQNAVFFTASKAVTHAIPAQIVPMLRARPQITLAQALLSLGHAVPEVPPLQHTLWATSDGGRLQ